MLYPNRIQIKMKQQQTVLNVLLFLQIYNFKKQNLRRCLPSEFFFRSSLPRISVIIIR
jgi:hypothetical protein